MGILVSDDSFEALNNAQALSRFTQWAEPSRMHFIKAKKLHFVLFRTSDGRRGVIRVKVFVEAGAQFNEEGFLLKRVSMSVVVERYDYIKRKRFTESQTWMYEWDGAGQLMAVSNNEQKDMDGKPVRLRFEYDALGRRTAKISVWGRSAYHRVTRFLWDGDVLLHEWTYEGSEPPKTKLTKEGHRYYPEGEPETELTTSLLEEGTFVPLAQLVGERSYPITCDHLGTPTAAYDEAGNRVWQRELDIYGRVRQEEGETNSVPFLFQGQYHDHETELAYNRFRYYAPELGRYISQDPIGLAGGIKLYEYVEDTLYFSDPLGLSSRILNSSLGGSRKGMQAHPTLYQKKFGEITFVSLMK